MPDITWTHNGSPINTSSHRMQLSSSGLSLTLTNLLPRDRGVYKVLISNSEGSDNRTFSMDILFPPVVLHNSVLNNTRQLGDNITFMISLTQSSNPSPNWFVFHNHIPLSETLYRSNISRTKDIFMVTRNHLKVSDGGLYTCVVNNTQGSDRVTFRLDVQAPPIVDTFSALNTTRMLGENATFYVTLKYTPNPMPAIAWMHNGSLINTRSDRMQLSSNGLSLTLKNLLPADGGVYTIFVNNSLGTANATFSMDIQVPPVVYMTSTLNSTKQMNENISFSVTLRHTPNPLPTITWLHNGSPINLSASRMQLSSDSLSLNLTHLGISDAGWYIFSIRNTIGTEVVKFFLDVQVPPVVDTFATLNSTKEFSENISFYVTLTRAPNPLPTITWLHNGLPINKSGSKMQLSSNILSLNLTDLAVSDTGFYTVLINNTLGSEKVMFFLEVQELDN
ncbi:hemicentin-1-like [Sycon ciliatum]|uniref:hemicentin-1-like n=1 Tax=Sycon ciliatum TaxID=27933 RepID=UPI0031F6F11C